MTRLYHDSHFARHCSGVNGASFSQEDDGYHSPPWLHGRQFEPDPRDGTVSGLWVEHNTGDETQRIDALWEEFNRCRRIKSTHQLAILDVQTIEEVGAAHSRDLHVFFTPIPELPSHSEIRGIESDDYVLQQKLADLAILHGVTIELQS